jgi:hypothetical protein
MAQQGLVDGQAAVRQRLDRALKVNGVPQDDGGNDEVESARAITPMLEAAIADLAKGLKAERVAQQFEACQRCVRLQRFRQTWIDAFQRLAR